MDHPVAEMECYARAVSMLVEEFWHNMEGFVEYTANLQAESMIMWNNASKVMIYILIAMRILDSHRHICKRILLSERNAWIVLQLKVLC